MNPPNLSFGNGNFDISVTGPWFPTLFCEVPIMSILSEMHYYGVLKNSKLSNAEIGLIYGQMINKIMDNIRVFRTVPDATFTEFGTRRRHSRMWQSLQYGIYREAIPRQCAATSNVLEAMISGSSNPKGTNAHEQFMVIANLTDGDTNQEIYESQYRVVSEWYEMYPDLSIILPDTFGTTQFLHGAPEWMARDCVGARLDSKDPAIATQEFIDWWRSHGVDPQDKMLIPSDGLTAQKAVDLYREFGEKVGLYTFGIGTMLTNDCAGVWPRQALTKHWFEPFSMVMKAVHANGRSTVKLSDNPGKATGHPDRVARFREIFGSRGVEQQDIVV